MTELLFVLLPLAGFVLLATGVYRFSAVGTIALVIAYTVLSGLWLLLFKPGALLIFLAIDVGWAVARWKRVSRWRFFGLATGSAAVGVAMMMLLFLPRWNELQQLAHDYPPVRIDDRLAYEQSAAPAAETVPSKFGNDLQHDDDAYRRQRSLARLEYLHDDFAKAFVSVNSNGIGRMRIFPPDAEAIALPSPAALPQPQSPPDSTSAGDAPPAVTVTPGDGLRRFHRDQSGNFVNAAGFGAVLTDDRSPGETGPVVARGFQPHGFRNAPGVPGDGWRLVRLDLVSLLKHDPPAVYLSDRLPSMQELAAADVPTRPLDSFETAALAGLRDGEQVVTEQAGDRLRMLGALRSENQCARCHAVERGHLLGAFTYDFRRINEPEATPPAEPRPLL